MKELNAWTRTATTNLGVRHGLLQGTGSEAFHMSTKVHGYVIRDVRVRILGFFWFLCVRVATR